MGNLESIVWIKKSVYKEIMIQTLDNAPLETGGVLLGYVTKKGDAVILGVVGAGPKAIHTSTHFTPDHNYQLCKIIERFKETNGKENYIGDWHSHPNSVNLMSGQDKKTLLSIACANPEYLSNPYMLIMGKGKLGWDLGAHRLVSKVKGWFRSIKTEQVVMKLF